MFRNLFKYLFFICMLFTCIISAQEKPKKISRHWDSFFQHISIKADKETKFKLKGSVKVKQTKNDNTGKAYLWARVDIDDHESSFFENMEDRPITTNEWKEYEIEGTFSKNANNLYFGGIIEGDGEFYFDNFQLFIESNNGQFKKTKIENESFEKIKISDGWNRGIKTDKTINVAEFSYSISNDAVLGEKSLLITGKDTPKPADNNIKSEEGFTQNVGTLVSMLNNLKHRVESQVKALDLRETDHLMDEKANRIGALVLHLAAAEAYYQVFTFEGRSFNKEEKKKWETALKLGDEAKEEFQQKPISYYLDIYNKVREKTLAELKKRDDNWLEQSVPGYGVNNYYCWFHVMEHQSSHLGQILMMKKRIPDEKQEETIFEKKEDIDK